MKLPADLFSKLRRSFSRGTAEEPPADENIFFTEERSAGLRDRTAAGFQNVIESSLRAWREDPLARRIVSLTTQFSVGRGFRVSADDPASDEILHEFWEHPLNRMDARLTEWSDELCRTGNLFIMLSSDISGMTYVRAIPAAQIEEIIPMDNDIEQPVTFRIRETALPDAVRIPEVKTVPAASLSEPELRECMLHFTVNRPVGGQWGEPDLAPLLIWLKRYSDWLEDRTRLNHYRSSFIYLVRGTQYTETMCRQRQAQLNLRPPTPGTIMVTGDQEEWAALNPNLDSSDANEDGMAIKKLIAAGAGIPVSFLAESATASKAESGGMEDSACRNFRQRQQVLLFITETVLRHVLARSALVRRNADPRCEIRVYGDDIAAPGLSEGGIVRENTPGNGAGDE